jgi:hypothetical protein
MLTHRRFDMQAEYAKASRQAFCVLCAFKLHQHWHCRDSAQPCSSSPALQATFGPARFSAISVRLKSYWSKGQHRMARLLTLRPVIQLIINGLFDSPCDETQAVSSSIGSASATIRRCSTHKAAWQDCRHVAICSPASLGCSSQISPESFDLHTEEKYQTRLGPSTGSKTANPCYTDQLRLAGPCISNPERPNAGPARSTSRSSPPMRHHSMANVNLRKLRLPDNPINPPRSRLVHIALQPRLCRRAVPRSMPYRYLPGRTILVVRCRCEQPREIS